MSHTLNKKYYAEYDHGHGIDLWRFDSKEERDVFLEKNPSTSIKILAKEARQIHKEQWAYWAKAA